MMNLMITVISESKRFSDKKLYDKTNKFFFFLINNDKEGMYKTYKFLSCEDEFALFFSLVIFRL
jgi:hypothetical protein